MARVTIVRAANVRQYQTFQLDSDELSDEMLDKLASGDYEPDDLDPELEDVLDFILAEDYDTADEPQVNYMAEFEED